MRNIKTKSDGIAVAWKSDKFALLDEEHVNFDELTDTYDDSVKKDNWA